MDTAQLVIVEWEDSRQPEPGWERIAEFAPAGTCDCVSVGFLLYDGDDFKAIAPNMADIGSEDNMQASGVIHIPTRCVKKMTPLEETATSSSPRASGQERMLRHS